MKHYQIPSEQLVQIAEKHSLGKVRHVAYSEEGIVNPCLFINDDYVLRVNTRDPEQPKFRREMIAMQLLSETSVPVPEVVALNENRDIIEYDYLVTSRIDGESLAKKWFDLSSTAKATLVEQVGHHLATIHTVKTGGFGDVVEDKFGTHQSWGECIIERARQFAESTMRLNAFSQEEAGRLQEVLNAWKLRLNEVKSARLIHGDYHFGNLLFNGRQITGVLDFEWGGAADKDFEFRNYCEMFNGRDGYEPYLLGAYFTDQNKADNFAAKLVLYRLVWRIQLLEVAYLHWEDSRKELIRGQVTALLKQAQRDVEDL